MKRNFAILKNKKVTPTDLDTWAKWFDLEDCVVARTFIGHVFVSTVFLGVNCDDSSIWFETCVFGGKMTRESERYETYDEAASGHLSMVDRVRKAELN